MADPKKNQQNDPKATLDPQAPKTEEGHPIMTDTIKKIVKEVVGEGAEIVASGVVAGGLLALMKKIFTKATPKVQEHLEKKVEEILKGDIRTRADEVDFFNSKTILEHVSRKNKDLFDQKHSELLLPNFSGKSPEEVTELKKKQVLAKGLIFLINEAVREDEASPKKRYAVVNQLWYEIFSELDSLPDDNAKLQLLEQRILHRGKNSQENITYSEIVETLSMWSDEHIRPKPEDEYNGPISQIGKSFRKLTGR